jgi:hypothetical protein
MNNEDLKRSSQENLWVHLLEQVAKCTPRYETVADLPKLLETQNETE